MYGIDSGSWGPGSAKVRTRDLPRGQLAATLVPMKAYLDDQPLATDRPTLAAAIQAAAREAQLHGRIVVEVIVDGERAGDDLLDEPSEDAITSEVRLVSVEPRMLIRETLGDCAEALEVAKAQQIESAAMMQGGETEGALQPLSQALQTWQAVRDAVERSSSLLAASAPGGEAFDERELVEMLEELAQRLEEIRGALARQDWSALADVLAYDMPEQTARWRTSLGKMAERLN
jgi:hypothetical protein